MFPNSSTRYFSNTYNNEIIDVIEYIIAGELTPMGHLPRASSLHPYLHSLAHIQSC